MWRVSKMNKFKQESVFLRVLLPLFSPSCKLFTRQSRLHSSSYEVFSVLFKKKVLQTKQICQISLIGNDLVSRDATLDLHLHCVYASFAK